jgi:uncharacterized protein (TIGR00725 family)
MPPSPVRRLPIAAVFGAGVSEHGNPELAAALGALVAEMGFHLLTGGGLGVMADACRGFASVPGRAGLSIGIVPRSPEGDGPKAGYPNRWVDLPVFTHLAGRGGPSGEDSRNWINVLTAEKALALPGGAGTRAEIELALRHGKPLLAVVDASRLREEAAFLSFLEARNVPRHEARRPPEGQWDLGPVRSFLAGA